MTAPINNFYADPSSFAALKKSAGEQDPKALRETARQFESLFTQMMLKSMRDASKAFGSSDSPLGSDQTDFYREMFDNQIAMQMSKGKGLGLADMLVKQLQGMTGSAKSDATVETLDTRRETRTESTSDLSTVQQKQGVRIKEDLVNPMPPMSTETQGPSSPASGVSSPDADPSSVTNHASRNSRLDSASLASSPDNFIAQLWPHAEAVGKELGVDPRTLIAHAALETGWGKNMPSNPDGSSSFNLFGIKATGRWRGATVGVDTIEYQDGVATRQRASFRAYDSPAESFRDYAALIKNNPRYAAALGSGSDAAAFASALQQGGYATDPHYAAKLATVADRLDVTLKTARSQPLALGRSVSSGGET